MTSKYHSYCYSLSLSSLSPSVCVCVCVSLCVCMCEKDKGEREFKYYSTIHLTENRFYFSTVKRNLKVTEQKLWKDTV